MSRTSQILTCIRLAGDKDAGRLLRWLISWAKKANYKRGLPGKWNAHSREAIIAGAGLGCRTRYRRARDILIERGLVEFELHFFGGKKMIFTRPTTALTAHFPDAVNRCHGQEIRAEMPDTRPDTEPDTRPDLTPLILPSSCHPAKVTPARRGKGREGQESAVAPPAPAISPTIAANPAPQVCAEPLVRESSADRFIRQRDAERAADAALAEQVRAIQENPDLTPEARRLALLRLLPELTPAVANVVHPSKIPGRGAFWHLRSPENIVDQYVNRYSRYHANAVAAHGLDVGRRSTPAVRLDNSDWGQAGNPWSAHIEAAKNIARPSWQDIEAQERAKVVELREQGFAAPDIATRLGMSLALVGDHLIAADSPA